jgi:hypothetical protein
MELMKSKGVSVLTFLGQNPPFELRSRTGVSAAIFHGIHRGSSKYWPTLSPIWLVPLQANNQRLDLGRQLICMAVGPARAVGEPLQADLIVTGKDFVAGLAGDTELLAASACRPEAWQ